ncbi:hypothetical protein [Variovorax sp. JS1663]|uniref:hypothetical protein n=1 Tax=Variovorax sp. JS1663 TaxID=1851577 RepID=UPI000B3422DC|nr:hypothetical protein [Variovorax sp. JS1663]OUL98822.1 hypothetical protein A8M77_29455 [Variovorax sp. JS1663]
MAAIPITDTRREELRAALLDAADLLDRNKAGEVGDEAIDDYVDLAWLEWDGGKLRVTTTGRNICRQLIAGLAKPQFDRH